MIGQTKLINYIDGLKTVPHFIVIVGSKGSGKTTLAKYIAEKLNATFSVCGIKVDEIREIIDTAYRVRDKVVYCIKDGDTMRAEAKNAMLKITEEPPENAYFILTVQDESSLLATIKSRAVVLTIEPYSKQDIIDYATATKQSILDYLDIAMTPYELDVLNAYGKEFLEFVELVVDNIAEVEPSNAFKSSSKLALKSDEGYDLKLFFQTFTKICISRITGNTLKYANGAIATIPFEMECTKLGVNKQQLYDRWVFKIREVWA